MSQATSRFDAETASVNQRPTGAAAIATSYAALVDAPLATGLYLVATPIGHLGDVTLRAVSVLARADIVYCEDTRHTQKLTQHYGLKPRLEAYHDHNGDEVRPRILAALAAGRRIALVSDAGTPLVSDPGYKLVRAAIDAGHAVTALPGPSAVLQALSLAGLPTDAFFFAGFLPPKQAARQTRLTALARVPGTLVLFEAPTRVADSLVDIAEVLGRDRPVALARELTKLHETVLRGTAADMAARVAEAPLKGECVLLVGPPVPAVITDADLRTLLADRLRSLSVRDASAEIADEFEVPRTRVYDLALAVKREGES